LDSFAFALLAMKSVAQRTALVGVAVVKIDTSAGDYDTIQCSAPDAIASKRGATQNPTPYVGNRAVPKLPPQYDLFGRLP
jgi:hypothetical protein